MTKIPNTRPDDLKANGIDKIPVPNDAFSKCVNVSLLLRKKVSSINFSIVFDFPGLHTRMCNKISTYDVGCSTCRSVNGLNSLSAFSASFLAGWILYLGKRKNKWKLLKKFFDRYVWISANASLTHSIPFGMGSETVQLATLTHVNCPMTNCWNVTERKNSAECARILNIIFLQRIFIPEKIHYFFSQ